MSQVIWIYRPSWIAIVIDKKRNKADQTNYKLSGRGKIAIEKIKIIISFLRRRRNGQPTFEFRSSKSSSEEELRIKLLSRDIVSPRRYFFEINDYLSINRCSRKEM